MSPDLSKWILLLPEIVLIAAALAVMLVDLWVKPASKSGLAYLGLVGLLAGLAGVIPLLGSPGELWGNMLVVDGFSLFFKVLFILTGISVLLMAVDFVKSRGMAAGEFYSLLIFSVLGMMIMASSRDLVAIYVGLELSSISSYVLAGMLRDDPRSNEASIKYFLIGAMGSAILLFGMSLLYGISGTTHLAGIAKALAGADAGLLAAGFAGVIMLVTGFGIKVAAAPFHMWSPDVFEGAPTPVTAFLSVGPKAAAVAAVLRVFDSGLGPLQGGWTIVFAVLAVLSMFVGNLSALVQTNIKRMFAYSSIAHVGYILVGLTVATPRAYTAVAYYLAAYTFMNLLAFLVVVLLNDHGAGDEIDDYAGLSLKSPVYAGAMVLAFLSLIGIPPTAGFFGKFYLFASAIEAGWVWLAVVMVINSVISVGYYYGIVRRMYLSPATGSPATVRPPVAVGAVLLLTGAAVLALGVFPEPFLRWAELAAKLGP